MTFDQAKQTILQPALLGRFSAFQPHDLDAAEPLAPPLRTELSARGR